MAQFFIINYESLKKFFTTGMDKREKGKPFTIRNIHFNKTATDFFKAVIIDESHRVKSTATIQTKLTKGICIGKEWILHIRNSVINKPKDLVAQLVSLTNSIPLRLSTSWKDIARDPNKHPTSRT